MCTEGEALGPGKAFYAFFSYESRKPLKLNSKSEKMPEAVGGKATFMYEKRCFFAFNQLDARDFSKLFSNFKVFYAASGDSSEKNE